jgi:hypothetical protein
MYRISWVMMSYVCFGLGIQKSGGSTTVNNVNKLEKDLDELTQHFWNSLADFRDNKIDAHFISL